MIGPNPSSHARAKAAVEVTALTTAAAVTSRPTSAQHQQQAKQAVDRSDLERLHELHMSAPATDRPPTNSAGRLTTMQQTALPVQKTAAVKRAPSATARQPNQAAATAPPTLPTYQRLATFTDKQVCKSCSLGNQLRPHSRFAQSPTIPAWTRWPSAPTPAFSLSCRPIRAMLLTEQCHSDTRALSSTSKPDAFFRLDR